MPGILLNYNVFYQRLWCKSGVLVYVRAKYFMCIDFQGFLFL